jgi:hypothetical protein
MSKVVVIDGIQYVPKVEPKLGKVLHDENDQRLYLLLDQLRTDLGAMRDRLRIQNHADEMDRLGMMADRAIGILIGTSR